VKGAGDRFHEASGLSGTATATVQAGARSGVQAVELRRLRAAPTLATVTIKRSTLPLTPAPTGMRPLGDRQYRHGPRGGALGLLAVREDADSTDLLMSSNVLFVRARALERPDKPQETDLAS